MKSSDLKIIACISMFIDHVGVIFFPDIVFFTLIGRIALPIFSFLLVEGFFRTKNVKKYLIRLAAYALISEIPYDLAIFGAVSNFGDQNIFFTLFNGLLMIAICERYKKWYVHMVCLLVAMLINTLIHADYEFIGIIVIFGFYLFRTRLVAQIVFIACVNAGLIAFDYMDGGYEVDIWLFTPMFELLAFLFIPFYSGKRGLSLKYFFYAFYPAHLLLLWLVSIFF